MIPDISFGFSFFISSFDISSILSFKLLQLFLISSTNLLFSLASFISNNFFTKATRVEKSNYFFNKSLFMSFDSLSIKAMQLLRNPSISSSFVFSFISSFALNTLPFNRTIPFSKKPIISYLARNNFRADFKTLFFSSFFINSCFVVF